MAARRRFRLDRRATPNVLRRLRPELWVEEIARAVRRARGFLGDAAEALGVSRRTLQRWIHEDDRLEHVREFIAPTGVNKPKAKRSTSTTRARRTRAAAKG